MSITRTVSVRLTSTGGDGVRAELSSISEQADRLGTKTAVIDVDANQDDWEAGANEVMERAREMGANKVVLRIDSDTELAQEQIARLQAKADELGLRRIDIKVNVDDAEARARLDELQATSGGSGGGGGGGLGAILGNPYVLGGAGALAAALAPAAIGTGIGGGVGILGILGLDATSPQFQQTMTGLKTSLESTLSSALNANIGEPSFATQLEGIFKGIGGWAKTEIMPLGQMFDSAIPFIKMFVNLFEQAAKVLIPAFTQAMQQMAPSLPYIEQGIMSLVKAFATFLQIIGPAMKPSAELFEQTMQVLGWALEGLGALASGMAFIIEGAIKGVEAVVKWLIGQWNADFPTLKRFWTDVASAIKAALNIAGEMEQIGSNIIWGVIHGVESGASSLLSYVRRIASDISGAFSSVLGIFSPSRVFAQHGQDIVRGVALGIQDNSHLAVSAVQGLGRATSNGFATSMGRGAGGAGAMQIQWVGGQSDGSFMTWLKNNIRVRGGNPAVMGR